MTKLIAIGLSFFLVVPAFASTSITFGGATSNNVDHGAVNAIDDSPVWTVAVWARVTTLNNRRFYSKGNNSRFTYASSGDLSCFQARAANTNYLTNTVPISVNNWTFAACSMDINGSAGQRANIYTATKSSAFTEHTYGTASDGSGAVTSNAATNVSYSATIAGTNSMQGQMGPVWLFNRALSAAEINELQFQNWPMPGMLVHSHYGFTELNTQYDDSGNANNGTVSGSAVSNLGAPIMIQGGPI